MDSIDWGPGISYDAVVQEFQALQPYIWDIRSNIVEAPVIVDYAEYLVLHPFPRITIPDEPTPLPVGEEVVFAH